MSVISDRAPILTALTVRRKWSFSPVIYVRKTAYKANHRRPDKWVTLFFSDGDACPVLYAPNVGSHRCLQAGGNECELIGGDRGSAASLIGPELASLLYGARVGANPITIFAESNRFRQRQNRQDKVKQSVVL